MVQGFTSDSARGRRQLGVCVPRGMGGARIEKSDAPIGLDDRSCAVIRSRQPATRMSNQIKSNSSGTPWGSNGATSSTIRSRLARVGARSSSR